MIRSTRPTLTPLRLLFLVAFVVALVSIYGAPRAAERDRPSINPIGLEVIGQSELLSGAPAAILVCGDLSLEKSVGYWVVDCAAAAQNMLLAAHALGLGAVWTGVYPREPRIEGLRRLTNLPENVEPHSLIVLGYPAEHPDREDRYRADRVHQDRWK